MVNSIILSQSQRRKWFRISSNWFSEFMELKPSQRIKILKPSLEKLISQLEVQGFDSKVCSGLSLWVIENLENSSKFSWQTKAVRILHPMEREFITPEAYGLFLQVLRSGIVEAKDSENLLEDIAAKYPLPIEIDILEIQLSEFWLKKIGKYTPQ
jgi:hypothetical protein|tara:strand:+ start:3357 stop:3821 length:465 start_codon:yes stop_codon:yes gene_type:complete